MIAGLILRIFPFLDMTRNDPSAYEDYYEGLDPKTFVLDDSIWNDFAYQRPGIGYYRQLHTVYEMLWKEYRTITLFNFQELQDQIREFARENTALKQELAIVKQERDYFYGAAVELRKIKQNRIKEMEAKTVKGDDNKFVSQDGYSKIDKSIAAYIMNYFDYSNEEIAEQLGGSETSIPVYLSNARKEWAGYTPRQNEKGEYSFEFNTNLNSTWRTIQRHSKHYFQRN